MQGCRNCRIAACDHLAGETSALKQFERTCLYREGAGRSRSVGKSLDQAYRNAEPR